MVSGLKHGLVQDVLSLSLSLSDALFLPHCNITTLMLFDTSHHDFGHCKSSEWIFFSWNNRPDQFTVVIWKMKAEEEERRCENERIKRKERKERLRHGYLKYGCWNAKNVAMNNDLQVWENEGEKEEKTISIKQIALRLPGEREIVITQVVQLKLCARAKSLDHWIQVVKSQSLSPRAKMILTEASNCRQSKGYTSEKLTSISEESTLIGQVSNKFRRLPGPRRDNLCPFIYSSLLMDYSEWLSLSSLTFTCFLFCLTVSCHLVPAHFSLNICWSSAN